MTKWLILAHVRSVLPANLWKWSLPMEWFQSWLLIVLLSDKGKKQLWHESPENLMVQVGVWNFTHEGIWDTQLLLHCRWSKLILNLSSEISFPSLLSSPGTQWGVWVWDNPDWTHHWPLTSTHMHMGVHTQTHILSVSPSQYHLSWLKLVCLYYLWPGCYDHHKAKREPSRNHVANGIPSSQKQPQCFPVKLLLSVCLRSNSANHHSVPAGEE